MTEIKLTPARLLVLRRVAQGGVEVQRNGALEPSIHVKSGEKLVNRALRQLTELHKAGLIKFSGQGMYGIFQGLASVTTAGYTRMAEALPKRQPQSIELVWTPALGFPEGRAYDVEHEGVTWRIALVLHERPVGQPWLDDEPIDGWRLYKASGGRMKPIASPLRDVTFVRSVAALCICPKGVHR